MRSLTERNNTINTNLASLNPQLVSSVGIRSPALRFRFTFDKVYSNDWPASLSCNFCSDGKWYSSSESKTCMQDNHLIWLRYQKLISRQMFSIYQNSTGCEIVSNVYDRSHFEGFISLQPNDDLTNWNSEVLRVCLNNCTVRIYT